MKRSILSWSLLSALCLSGPLPIIACSNGKQPSPNEAVATGTVQIPLVTQVNGSTFRLIASLSLYGPTYDTIYTGDDPTQTVITKTLQTGSYTAYLADWTLQKLDKDGNFKAVSAYLSSDYYVNFTIYNQSSTTI